MNPSTYQLYIDGNWTEAADKARFSVINPATEEEIAQLPQAGRKEAEAAVTAAAGAWENWKNTNPFDRAALLKKAARAMKEKAEEYGAITTQESGKPLAEAMGEWKVAADMMEWFAEEAKRTYGVVIPGSRNGKRMQLIYQPVGVIGVITAWNFPVWNLVRPWGAALAAGCTLVAKPSEETPLTAVLLTGLLEKAGIPKGVINLVMGKAPEIGDILMEAPEVKKVHFVGSTQVGKLLMDKASLTNTRLSLELGGNAPVLVFPDADVKKVAASAVAAKFRNCGQVCIAPQRFLVHKDIAETFITEASKRINNYVVGNGMEAETQIGPLINKAQREKVREFLQKAVASGARVMAGGEPPAGKEKGYFFSPTLLTEVTEQSAVFREEIFGPVMAVTVFEDTGEAIRLANATPYGLAAYIWTNDLNTAVKVSEALSFGIVGINEWTPHATEAPFGGIKQSGQGSELGHDGIFEYMNKKLISIGGL